MKRVITVAALCAAAWPALAADVGVSIGISQPGVYGRVDIGRYPQPAVIVPQPVIIQRPVAVAPPPPAYMWVPPGHRKNWGKHCARYNACGVPVYFVQDRWYDDHVRYADRRGPPDRGGPPDRRDDDGRGRGHGHGKGKHD